MIIGLQASITTMQRDLSTKTDLILTPLEVKHNRPMAKGLK